MYKFLLTNYHNDAIMWLQFPSFGGDILELYERIRQRRKELNLTQEELAQKLGYKDRSAISRIESGANNLTQSKIYAFANALSTTTAWLMGGDAGPIEKPPTPASGDGRIQEFMRLFEQLTDAEKALVIAQIKGILASRESHPDQPPKV